MKKTKLSCIDCNADFEVKDDMGEGYKAGFCAFCGSEILSDYFDEDLEEGDFYADEYEQD